MRLGLAVIGEAERGRIAVTLRRKSGNGSRSNLPPQFNKSRLSKPFAARAVTVSVAIITFDFGTPRLKLHLAQAEGQNLITAYGAGYVDVNKERHERSLIVLPDALVTDWPPAALADLRAEHMEPLLGRELEVVLVGTGPTLRFPGPEILRPLMQARLGFEIMDTQAACRTYNILVDEGRHVAAALLLG